MDQENLLLNCPVNKPQNPCFSSGPCAKRPNWSLSSISTQSLGRSHRSKVARARINYLIDLVRDVLEIPSDYFVGIIGGSATGAIECAMWNLLGPRPVNIIGFDVFGHYWISDAVEQLKLKEIHKFTADYGLLPDIKKLNPDHDCIITFNGSTAGVCLPDDSWISSERRGLVICDATSIAFAKKFDWSKFDAFCFPWQKGLGGEAAHGILVLSQKATDRLNEYTPEWPIPKLFNLKSENKFYEPVFHGETINTPSLLCVEEFIGSLEWAKSIGGLDKLIERTSRNFQAIEEWCNKTSWIDFLALEPTTRSHTTVCLKIVDPKFTRLPYDDKKNIIKMVETKLEELDVAYDIANHRFAEPSFRIWAGPTVEVTDIKILLEWLSWGYEKLILPTIASHS